MTARDILYSVVIDGKRLVLFFESEDIVLDTRDAATPVDANDRCHSGNRTTSRSGNLRELR